MQPDFNSYTANDKPNKWSRKQVLILLGIVTGLLILWLGWTGVQSTYFRVAGTEPRLSNITTVTPYIHVKFNRVLSGDNLKISDPGKIMESRGLNDKTLELNLNLGKLKAGDKHTITIESIQSDKGEKITGKKLSFTVKEGSLDKLSPEEQTAALNRQDRFPYSPDVIGFDGTTDLLDAGVTSDQYYGFKQAVYEFSKTINKEFNSVRIYKASIAHPENTDPIKSTTSFTVDADGTTYAMQLDTWDITVAQLRVYDAQTNALLFTSEPIDKSTPE